MEKVKIAMLGFGTIGRGVYKVMNDNRAYITSNSGKVVELSRILVRPAEKDTDELRDNPVFTTDINDIINDGSLQIVIELMGGEQPATDFMLRALKAGKHVVTANKLALAKNGHVLLGTARNVNLRFEYEASVGGGIPIIRLINESFNANKAESIIGIINGTSNYILSRMTKSGMDFDEALKTAQKKGYAEADPASDVGGHDAVYKLAIMSSLAFSTEVNYQDIYREGMDRVSAQDIKNAARFGYVIKLLAIAREVDKKMELRVHPAMIPEDHPMANISGSYNAIYITGNAVDDIMISGKGAGSMPTASAVVSDVINIVKGQPPVPGVGEPRRRLAVIPIEETLSRRYLCLRVADAPGVLALIAAILGGRGVSISQMVQEQIKSDEGAGSEASLIFITHPTLEGSFCAAVREILALDCVKEVSSNIRIEEFD
ncbi:MAG: homoserine dehydrogenase [Oscillospiraceae bacterium]|jgi:homoserine dehydrogenase|nr:homoserine dehydrogenase [Oscillospiraceae bacterium]